MNNRPGRPPIRRVLETSLYVSDLGRSERFYGELLGFSTMLRNERMCAMAVPGRQVLLLFREGASTHPSMTPFGPIPPHDGHGTLHLCFSIERQDLDAWVRYLEASGVPIESRLDWKDGGSSLYFRDPDNHSLEVATSKLWPNDPGDDS